MQLNTLSKEHQFYIKLIEWFAPIFPSVSPEKITILSEAAYLYFRFLLSFDEFTDSQNSNETEKLEKFIALQQGFENYEMSVRKLTYLFETENFWRQFATLKNTYFQTILFEKKLSKEKTNIDEVIFEQLAKGKSVICLNAVYALQFLAKDFSQATFLYEKELIFCINEIHIALQLVDDIEDFKKDYTEKQWTYPHSLVAEYIKQKQLVVDDILVKHKYLYISGIAEANLQKAIAHFQNAKDVAQKLNLSNLCQFLNKEIKSIQFYFDDINILKQKAFVKSQKSNVFVENNFLEKAIQNGIYYLEKNLDEDNTWSDFMTSAGAGKAWVTTFIAFQLAEIDRNLPIVEKIKKAILRKLYDFLSYNQEIIQDGDSTSFLIGFLQKSGSKIPQDVFNSWQTFFSSEIGGWKTYIDERKLRNLLDLDNTFSVQAWLSPKVCVSAVSAYILSDTENELLYKKTCDYLLNSLDGHSKWQSYWWTSPIYATSFSIMALSKSEKYKANCLIPTKWLAEQQCENLGCWRNPFEKEPSPFYSALAIKALISFDFQEYEKQIFKGISWLLNNQTQDGSWQTNRILQIPAPDIENPKNVTKWRNSSFGYNCVTDDYNRVFTTSIVFNCLSHAKKTFPHAH
jgi:Squalene-hopene cyclase C-terminal domain